MPPLADDMQPWAEGATPRHVPVPYEPYPMDGVDAHATRSDSAVSLRDLWRILLRRRWLILGCVLAALGLAMVALARAKPLYEASTSIRIDAKAPNLPEVIRSLSGDPGTTTEMDELGSRSLAEAAVRQLGLRMKVLEPSRVPRAALFKRVAVAADAPSADYVLQRRADGGFAVRADPSGTPLGVLRPGVPSTFGGVTVVLTPAALRHERIQLSVQPLESAAGAVRWATSVGRGGGGSNMLTVSYRSEDPDLVWRVPNAIVAGFTTRRQGFQHRDTRGMVDFLREQLDTVNRQLATSEEKLQRFREREGVVNPETEANSQIGRLVSLQAERGSLEAERQALNKLMGAVETEDSTRSPGAPSPYRRLMAFPTLLRDRTSSDELRMLADLENQRGTLLLRRTERDPDVQVLSARIKDLENQVRSTALTYLQGLTSQIAGIDSTLRGFDRQLAVLPQQQVQYARLDRQPKVLEQMVTLLQTRLKEAEIAGAVEDASVRVVDTAIAPLAPFKPRRSLYMIGALVGGLLLGVALAFTREFRDTSVRTRADVRLLTGLPVMGLIPRLKHRSQRAIRAPDGVDGLSQARPAASHGGRKGSLLLALLPARRRRAGSTGVPLERGNGTATPRHSLVASTAAGRAAVEAYSVLQMNIAHAGHGDAIRTVVFTSALPGEGKTTSAVNLALTLTQRGLNVLLVDADLRGGVVHQLFGLPRAHGLAEALRGTLPVEAVRHAVDLGHGRVLHVVAAGAAAGETAGLHLDAEAMRLFLRRCQESHTLVILDGPPVNIIADAALLSVQVDGVVLVARAGVTESAALGYALDQLRQVAAPVLGVVLNDIDFRKEAKYDPTYRYCDYGKYAVATE